MKVVSPCPGGKTQLMSGKRCRTFDMSVAAKGLVRRNHSLRNPCTDEKSRAVVSKYPSLSFNENTLPALINL
jgi:hypothetical protein